MKDIKKEIQDQLSSLQQGNLYDNALSFFETLGYNTQRRNRLANHTFQAFEDTFLQKNEPFSKENALTKDWKSVELLFQLTDNEVRQSISLFQNLEVNNTLIESYLFFAIELKEAHYNRTALSKITREINRIFPMPVMVFFRYGEVVTLAMIHRRIHKKDREKDVLEKVTLLKDIFLTENLTHRAHIDILADLQFQHLSKHYNITNFVELHNAWQKVFDIKELNKRFYKELFDWYLWAVRLVKFPKPENEILDNHSHQSISVIRLLTRLIFVWFIKEKNLLNPSLFDTTILANLLKDFKPDDIDSAAYYQGILQNLFFATLNSPMTQDAENEYEKRQFVEDLPTFHGKNEAYNDKSKYRGRELFKESRKQEIITLLEETPFLNGGLFECLDWRDEVTNKEIRYDGFSVNKDKRAKVPNILFFGKATIDLSKELDDKKRKGVAVKGIIDILKSYKFTIAENTPLEEEIALDPELLGKVFENLLASYNPETQSSARKQTGSFYTPREIVDYMVVESLKAYFSEKLRTIKENSLDEVLIDKKLQALFSYADKDKENPFDSETTKTLIEALSDCKILDPACGSGAYPMGALNTMVYILTKLDPNNLQWKITLQNRAKEDLKTAQKMNDDVIRPQAVAAAEARIAYIEDSFAQRNHEFDYTRKLFLIENCIYGVDIQQIAVQISKLRFFISLIVEQTITEGAKNRGILSMPNLETKFVAANTLIGLEKNDTLISYKVIQTEKALDEKRKEIFFVKRWKDKKKLKEQEKQIREQLKLELKDSGFDEKTATQKTSWNPFDVIHSASFFDKETMFGEDLKAGFDVVIGNPPYIKEYTYKKAFDGLRNSPYYQGKMDLWYLFACSNLDVLKKETGILSFIATNNWTTNSGASKMRNKVINDSQIVKLLDFGNYMIFENADIQTMVMFFRNSTINNSYSFKLLRIKAEKTDFSEVLNILSENKTPENEILSPNIIRKDFIDKSLTFADDIQEQILQTIKAKANFFLDEKNEIANGIHPHYDYVNKNTAQILGMNYRVGQGIFVLSNQEKERLHLTEKELVLIKPYYTTAQLQKWYGNSHNTEWIIYTDSRFKKSESMNPYPNLKKHLDQFQQIITSDNKPYGLHRAREEKFFKGEKIIALRKCVGEPKFTYTDFDCYVSATFYVIKSNRINQKYLISILNSKLIAFWLKNKGKMQGNNYQLDKEPLLAIPIFNATSSAQQPFIRLVEYILWLKTQDFADVQDRFMSVYFEQVIDGMVYELYFSESFQKQNKAIIANLGDLPEISSAMPDTEKLAIIRSVFQRLDDKKHLVRNHLFYMDSIPEVALIMGKQ